MASGEGSAPRGGSVAAERCHHVVQIGRDLDRLVAEIFRPGEAPALRLLKYRQQRTERDRAIVEPQFADQFFE